MLVAFLGHARVRVLPQEPLLRRGLVRAGWSGKQHLGHLVRAGVRGQKSAGHRALRNRFMNFTRLQMSDATVSVWNQKRCWSVRLACFLPETTYVAPQRYPRVIRWIRRYHPQRWGLGADSTVRNKTTVQMSQASFLARCKQGWEQSPKRWYFATQFSNFETSPPSESWWTQNRKEGSRIRPAHFVSHTKHQETLPEMDSHETIYPWKWFSWFILDITGHITIQTPAYCQCVHVVLKEMDGTQHCSDNYAQRLYNS